MIGPVGVVGEAGNVVDVVDDADMCISRSIAYVTATMMWA
jgi:hypothetical protein